MLAGRVLKIAQSAAFAPVGTITSLQDAVVRLGLRNLSEIAWEVSLGTRVFRSHAYGDAMEMVRRHSTACAYLAAWCPVSRPWPRSTPFCVGCSTTSG